MAVGTALAFAAGNVRAQETTQADQDKALAYLESTKKGVLDATRGLSGAQWNFEAAPDKWSVAECVEHGGGFHSRHGGGQGYEGASRSGPRHREN
jgi:hypothetical protein